MPRRNGATRAGCFGELPTTSHQSSSYRSATQAQPKCNLPEHTRASPILGNDPVPTPGCWRKGLTCSPPMFASSDYDTDLRVLQACLLPTLGMDLCPLTHMNWTNRPCTPQVTTKYLLRRGMRRSTACHEIYERCVIRTCASSGRPTIAEKRGTCGVQAVYLLLLTLDLLNLSGVQF